MFVQEGGGAAILGDTRKTVEAGTTIYVPQGVWHAVENPGNEMHLLWVVTPPGLEGFFREIATPPGAPLKALTPEQLSDIAGSMEPASSLIPARSPIGRYFLFEPTGNLFPRTQVGHRVDPVFRPDCDIAKSQRDR